MGREVKRVPVDFDWPLRKVWEGYLMPDRLDENPCPACKNGYSPHAEHLHDLWYGYVPFSPADTGSEILRAGTPAVRAFAERNVASAPDFYGTSELAIVCEALRLADLWNGMWCHHLCQDDVDALVAAGRLMDFTHTWSRENGWQKKDAPVTPTAAQVNEWSLSGFGHDSINAMVVISARCERAGVSDRCATCQGHGSLEAYEGQRAEAEAWQPAEPPEGDGWQLWETVTEGSPISPVFADAEGLAQWLASSAAGRDQMGSITVARAFVAAGWAPTFVGTPETGLVSGAEFIGTRGGRS